MSYYKIWAETYIPIGKKNAVTLDILSCENFFTKRAIRKRIEKARDDGVIILNDGDGKGYYISTDIDEIERQYWKDKSRALSVLKRLKAMRKILKENGRNV